MRKLPKRDPIAAYARSAVAGRRVSANAKCKCGESRPEAVIKGSNPPECIECDRKKRGQTIVDDHHVAGEANDQATIPVGANDHKARLSVDQYDWPKETLRNPDGSPLLAAAARIRGFVDVVIYLIEKLLLGTATMLETLDAYLVSTSGAKWWLNTPLEKLQTKR